MIISMNKKGFTLVELLAVIAILAILVLLALPNVLEMFNTGKQKSFFIEVGNVYKAAQQQFVLDNGGAKTYYKGDLTLDGEQLDYYVEINSTGVTKLYVSNNSFVYSNENSAGISIESIDTKNYTLNSCDTNNTKNCFYEVGTSGAPTVSRKPM